MNARPIGHLVGEVVDYAGASVPDGWLECDGQAVSRAAYPLLFAALGTAWGAGDGSTTFNVPDLRGRTTIGAGKGTGGNATQHDFASEGGDEQMQAHGHDSPVAGYSGYRPAIINQDPGEWPTTLAYWERSAKNRMSTEPAGGGSHGNMQPFATVRKLVRAA